MIQLNLKIWGIFFPRNDDGLLVEVRLKCHINLIFVPLSTVAVIEENLKLSNKIPLSSC